MSGPLRVLVVDDSAFMRMAIREMMNQMPEIEVVGTARNGEDALYQTAHLKPDVVTVDLFMPEMDGVTYIREQMQRKPLPVVVISSADVDADHSLEAIEAGAIEFVKKPTSRAIDKIYEIRHELHRAIQAAGAIPASKLPVINNLDLHEPKRIVLPSINTSGRIKAILIGISTGGPQALRKLLPRFPANFPAAIAIALHIPEGYTRAIAKRLSEISALEVVESADGMEMKPGRVILAKAGANTLLKSHGNGMVVAKISYETTDSLYMPSVDLLFQSGAEAYGNQVLGAVMTGMGNDGTTGAAWIKAKGGLVYAEAESSSIIYGMPRAVAEAGLVDRVAPLEGMVEAILEAL